MFLHLSFTLIVFCREYKLEYEGKPVLLDGWCWKATKIPFPPLDGSKYKNIKIYPMKCYLKSVRLKLFNNSPFVSWMLGMKIKNKSFSHFLPRQEMKIWKHEMWNFSECHHLSEFWWWSFIIVTVIINGCNLSSSSHSPTHTLIYLDPSCKSI